MQGEQILAEYREIAAITRRMLDAAQHSDWDALVALERSCGSHFLRLMQDFREQPDGEDFQRRKAELIRGILDDDAEIRLLVEPWLSQLSALIGNTQQQSRLHRAYQSGE